MRSLHASPEKGHDLAMRPGKGLLHEIMEILRIMNIIVSGYNPEASVEAIDTAVSSYADRKPYLYNCEKAKENRGRADQRRDPEAESARQNRNLHTHR